MKGLVLDPSYWLIASDLNLAGRWEDEWDGYLKNLNLAGIRLTTEKDIISWSKNPTSGQVTARIAYRVIIESHIDGNRKWWYGALWKWKLPLKIKCFLWLVFNDKILTWENLMRRGKHGPNIYSLCRRTCETVDHLFLHCSFSIELWEKICLALKIEVEWPNMGFEKTYQIWMQKHLHLKIILGLVAWSICNIRNQVIFQDTTSENLALYIF